MKTNFLKTVGTYGVLFGVLMIIEFLILYKIDIDAIQNPNLGIFVNLLNYMILPVVFVILAIRSYKYKYNGGYVSFSEVLRIGAATTVVAALVYSLFNLAFNFMVPEFVDQTIAKMREIALHQRESMLAQGAKVEEVFSIEQIDQNLKLTKESMKSFFSIPMTIIMYAIIGIVAALIIGAFVKKDKPQPVTETK